MHAEWIDVGQRGDLARCIMGVRRFISYLQYYSDTTTWIGGGLSHLGGPSPKHKGLQKNIQLLDGRRIHFRILFYIYFLEIKILEAFYFAHSPPRGNDIDSS